MPKRVRRRNSRYIAEALHRPSVPYLTKAGVDYSCDRLLMGGVAAGAVDRPDAFAEPQSIVSSPPVPVTVPLLSVTPMLTTQTSGRAGIALLTPSSAGHRRAPPLGARAL